MKTSNQLTQQHEDELNAAIGEYGCTDSNPCGVCFYFDSGEEKPFRIADDHTSESFAAYEELLEAASNWKEAFDAE